MTTAIAYQKINKRRSSSGKRREKRFLANANMKGKSVTPFATVSVGPDKIIREEKTSHRGRQRPHRRRRPSDAADKKQVRKAGVCNKVKENRLVQCIKRIINQIAKKAASIKRLPFYAVGVLTLLIVILFLTSSVPSVGMTAHGPIELPNADEVDSLLYSYIMPEATPHEQELRIPQPETLSTVRPSDYQVKRGDTLSEIADEYDVSLGTLISFNNIEDVRRIKVGTDLKIPPLDGVLYQVKRGDSLSVIANHYNVSLNKILDANGLESSIIRVGQELFIPGASISDFALKKATGKLFLTPTKGRLTSPYGMRTDPFTGVWRMHYGIDIANATGTPVKAAMGGTVGSVGYHPKGYGRYIIINHPDGFQSLYAHLLKSYVDKGDRVYQGEKIGEMGNSGRSTGPHLHFSIYQYQKPINPDKFLY